MTLSDIQQGLDAHKYELSQLKEEFISLKNRFDTVQRRLEVLSGTEPVSVVDTVVTQSSRKPSDADLIGSPNLGAMGFFSGGRPMRVRHLVELAVEKMGLPQPTNMQSVTNAMGRFLAANVGKEFTFDFNGEKNTYRLTKKFNGLGKDYAHRLYRFVTERTADARQTEVTQRIKDTIAQNSGKTLRQFIFEALQNTNGPLTYNEVAEIVLERGYVTASKKSNFPSMVLHILIQDNAFRRATRKQTRPARFVLAAEESNSMSAQE
jgi:hypothetical protein